MFLRLISFMMILSVIFARNIQHDDNHVSSSEVPCLMEKPLLYHFKREAMSHEIDKSSSMPIFAIKNDDHHPSEMLLKKRATIDKDLHITPKPGCCG